MHIVLFYIETYYFLLIFVRAYNILYTAYYAYAFITLRRLTMTDIHCHILFGLDDGSAGLDESVRMASLAYSGGTRQIVATPHCNIPGSYRNHWNDDTEDRFRALRHAVEKAGIDVKIYPGNEIFCAGRFITLLKQGALRTLNDSRYALVEFDFDEYSSSVYMKLEQLAAEGFVPVVAHPERYGFTSEEPDAIMRLKDIGCLLQVNKGSLKGAFGFSARQTAMRIMEERLADFVASDAHSPFVRTPYLADADELISETYSDDYARLVLWDNPAAAVADKRILSF